MLENVSMTFFVRFILLQYLDNYKLLSYKNIENDKLSFEKIFYNDIFYFIQLIHFLFFRLYRITNIWLYLLFLLNFQIIILY